MLIQLLRCSYTRPNHRDRLLEHEVPVLVIGRGVSTNESDPHAAVLLDDCDLGISPARTRAAEYLLPDRRPLDLFAWLMSHTTFQLAQHPTRCTLFLVMVERAVYESRCL